MVYKIIFFVLFSIFRLSAQETDLPLIKLSQDILKSLRQKENSQAFVKEYEMIKWSELKSQLNTKDKKLAFWINTYNAFVIQKLTVDSTRFEDKGSFYKNRDMNIAGMLMSFDDIEHGIIRNDRLKLSYGFFYDPFNPGWISELKNSEIDGRVHFALNCGAIDCPPVAVYNELNLDAQLDKITKAYLTKHTENIGPKKVKVSPLLGWFRGDFGDISGIKRFLVNYQIIPESKGYKVVFGNYDWTLRIDNYTDL